jgi:riboflavin kinase / FMN adenylyltransferase
MPVKSLAQRQMIIDGFDLNSNPTGHSGDITQAMAELEKHGSSLTIGNFDGVHLGHRALIRRVIEVAQSRRCLSAVMIFDPHPSQILSPNMASLKMFSLADQIAMLQSLGIDIICVQKFSRELSKVSASDFFNQFVLGAMKARALIVGHDFRLGANRDGTIDVLSKLCMSKGIKFESLAAVLAQASVLSSMPTSNARLDNSGQSLDLPRYISSSLIRRAISSGQMRVAKELLGRRFYVSGNVIRGAGRGHQIGIPTANIDLTSRQEIFPGIGVYSALASFGAKSNSPCVVNVGRNPTFVTSGQVSVEVHLLDQIEIDLYGQELRIEFLDHIRGEMKFSGAPELVRQIHRDIAVAREQLTLS